MKKLLVSVALLAFLFVGLFGMNLSMSKNTDGKMAKCPLINSSSSICQMGVLEHISKWQQVLQAIPSSAFFLFALGLLFIARSFYSRAYFLLSPPQRNSPRLYYKEHPDINLFNSLLLAFSDGILHPKIYK